MLSLDGGGRCSTREAADIKRCAFRIEVRIERPGLHQLTVSSHLDVLPTHNTTHSGLPERYERSDVWYKARAQQYLWKT